MATRRSSVDFLGDDAQLNATLARIETKLRGVSAVSDETNAKMAAGAEASGARLGKAYDEGTTRAAHGLSKLSALGASFGIPMAESLDKVGRKLDETTAKSHKLSGVLAEAGKVTLGAGLAGFTAAAYEGVKAAEKFQTSTASIAANAGITQVAADKIGKAFLDTAGHSVFSGQAMASSFAAVSGQLKITEGHALNSAQALRVMTSAGDLAEATHQNLATSTSALSQTMQAYSLKVGQASTASDVLFNVSKSLNVPVDGVSNALGKLHGRLGELAPTLKDTGGLMIDLGQHGITGTRGVQVVNTALQTLVGGSKKTTDVLHALGVSVFDQNGKFIGLHSVIEQLQPKLAGLTQQQQVFAEKALFGSGASQVLGQIVAQGAPKFDTAANAATRLGTAHRAAELQAHTLQGELHLIAATVIDLGTKFGGFLIPKLQATGAAISDVIGWLGKHKAAAEALAITIVGVLGTAVTVFAYTKAVAFVNATKDMVGGISKFAGGVADAATKIGEKFGLINASATGAATKTAATEAGMVTTADGTATDMALANARAGASFTEISGGATAELAPLTAADAALLGEVQTTNSAIEASNARAAASFASLDTAAAGAGAAAGLGVGGTAAAAGATALVLSGDSGPMKTYPKHPPGFPQVGMPSTGEGLQAYIKATLGLPSGYKGGPLTAGSYHGANVDHKSIDAFFKWLGEIGTFGKSGFARSRPAGSFPQLNTNGNTLQGSPSWGGGSVPVPTTGSNWQRIAGALHAQGFSKTAIAGILGNFARETGGDTLTGINTRDTGNGASGMGGMGIGQWNGPRYYAEKSYAAAHGEAPTSLAAQIGYLVQELRTSYHGAFNAIQGASSPQQAAAAFNKLFEGGTDPGGVRERAAAQAYSQLGGGGAGGGNSALAKLMGATGGGGAGGKATMRYVNHHPVGAMTEAQWQAYQAAHPAAPASHRQLLYSAPLDPGTYQVSRTDQGQDYASIHGPLKAVGDGVITLAQSLSGFGQTLVEKLTSGPDKGQSIYYGLETGATGVGLRAGQHVRAGQAVAQGRGSGAVELGFWDPKTGHALDNQGFNGSNATPGGQAFLKFVKSLGSQGIFETVSNKTGAVTGGNQQSDAYTIKQALDTYNKAWKKYITTLSTNATSELTRLGNAVQSGTIRTLSAILGENTSTMVTQPSPYLTGRAPHGYGGLSDPNAQPWPWLHGRAPRGYGGLSAPPGTPTSQPRPALSVNALLGQAFSKLGGNASIDQINRVTGTALTAGAANSPQEAAFNKMIDKLVATHNKGLENLATKLVAAHKAALQTLGQELYANQVTKNAETVALVATQTKDLTTMQANYDADMLNVQKAWYQMANDKAQAQVTAIRDMTTVVQDQFAGMVQSVTDSAKLMSDAANATVQGIQDQTQVQVDILGERGLYGLNLVAQKLQVQLDQTKASDNQKIAFAQQNVDAVTANWHAATSTAQIGLDQLTAQQDALVSQAQLSADLVSMQQLSRIAVAQAKMDAMTLHEDVSVIGPAQTAVDLNATAPRAVQDVFAAQLKGAMAVGGLREAASAQQYQGVYDSAQGIIGGAGQTVTDAQNAASLIIGLAGLNVTAITGQANQAIAGAQGLLTGAQDTAALNEAPLASGVALTQARAATQFAGSGLVVNIYGADLSNPTAVSNEASWAMRQLINS